MSFSVEEVESLLQVARDATLGRTFRERIDAITTTLRDLVPCTTFSAYVIDPRPGAGPGRHLVFLDRDPSDLARYTTHYRFLDPMAPSFPLGDGAPRTLTEHLPPRAFGKDEFTSDYLPSVSVRHILAFSHWLPGGEMFALGLHREPGLRDFSARERQVMRFVSPDVRRAVEGAFLEERLQALARDPAPDVGAFVFDGSGAVVHADPGAVALAQHLASGRSGAGDVLAAEVRALLEVEPRALTTIERVVPLADSCDLLRCRFTAQAGSGRRWVIVLLERLPAGSTARLEALARRAGLSPREAEVCRLALGGEDRRALAEVLGISVVTVGVHLTRVYRKLRVRGRRELIELLHGGGADPPA